MKLTKVFTYYYRSNMLQSNVFFICDFYQDIIISVFYLFSNSKNQKLSSVYICRGYENILDCALQSDLKSFRRWCSKNSTHLKPYKWILYNSFKVQLKTFFDTNFSNIYFRCPILFQVFKKKIDFFIESDIFRKRQDWP